MRPLLSPTLRQTDLLTTLTQEICRWRSREGNHTCCHSGPCRSALGTNNWASRLGRGFHGGFFQEMRPGGNRPVGTGSFSRQQPSGGGLGRAWTKLLSGSCDGWWPADWHQLVGGRRAGQEAQPATRPTKDRTISPSVIFQGTKSITGSSFERLSDSFDVV